MAEQLDLARFETWVRAVDDVAGRPLRSPQILVAVWIYAFSRGLHSVREHLDKLERLRAATKDDKKQAPVWRRVRACRLRLIPRTN